MLVRSTVVPFCEATAMSTNVSLSDATRLQQHWAQRDGGAGAGAQRRYLAAQSTRAAPLPTAAASATTSGLHHLLDNIITIVRLFA